MLMAISRLYSRLSLSIATCGHRRTVGVHGMVNIRMDRIDIHLSLMLAVGHIEFDLVVFAPGVDLAVDLFLMFLDRFTGVTTASSRLVV